MVKFREKIFVWSQVAKVALNVVPGVIGAANDAKAGKEAAEQAADQQQQQLRLQKKQMDAQIKTMKTTPANPTQSAKTFSIATGITKMAGKIDGVLGEGATTSFITSGAQMGLGAIQGKQQMKSQEKLQKQQMELQAKADRDMAKAMNKVAQAASKNPEAAGAAIGYQEARKSFSNSSSPKFRNKVKSVFKDGRQIARDIFEVGKVNKTVANGIAGGLSIAGIAYGVDKLLTHDSRKNGLLEERTEKEKDEARKERRETLKKLGIGTAAGLGTAALATLGAKKGVFGKNVQDWSKKNITASKLKEKAGQIGSDLKEGFKHQFDTKVYDSKGRVLNQNGKILKPGEKPGRNYTSLALTLGTGVALPIVNHLLTKRAIKEQERQSEYSIKSIFSGIGKAVKEGAQKFKKAPVKTTLSGISRFKNMGGEKGLDKFTSDLTKRGIKSQREGGSDATLKVAGFLHNHKNLALLGSIGLAGVLLKPTEWGNKAGRKIAKTIDTDAYAYDDARNGRVEE